MDIFKRESKEDQLRKELGADLQNLSEQIGKLQRDLTSKNAELEQLRKQASQSQQQDAAEDQAHTKHIQQLTEQANQRAAELTKAQAQLRELEGQVAVSSSYPQPPTAAAQPGQTSPQPGQPAGQPAQPSGTPGLEIGGTAYVAQAGGLPLRLRSSPGLGKDTVIGKLPPGTQMTLLGGPQEKDGYTWWQIRTADNREGWVAGQDLRSRPE